MFRTLFKVVCRLALAVGAVFAVLTVLQHLDKKKADYVEIYNDDGLDEEYF